jgi:hypothetical protein
MTSWSKKKFDRTHQKPTYKTPKLSSLQKHHLKKMIEKEEVVSIKQLLEEVYAKD